MGQGLPHRIISRRAIGTADLSCNLSTGAGRRFGRFVSAPVPHSSFSPTHHRSTGRVTGSASCGVARASHQSTLVRVPPDRQVPGALV